MSADCNKTQQSAVTRRDEFDVNSGLLIERVIFNHRAIVLVFFLLVTLVLGLQTSKLRLNASFERGIPTAHPYIANYMAHKNALQGMTNVLRVVIESRHRTIFDAEYMDTLRKVNDELFLLPGVDRPFLKSLWTSNTRWLGVTEDGLDGGPVIPDEFDSSPQSMARLRANIERSGEIGQLVAPDFQSSMIVVPLLEHDPRTGEDIDYHELSLAVERIRAKYESDALRLHVTGFAKVVGDLLDGLRQMLVFFAATVAIAVAILYSATRCVRSTAAVVTCSLVAVVWLLGVLPTFGYILDPYSILVPFLVFAIGMSHGAQKMNGIMQDVGRGAHKLLAARYTFRRLILAGTTALLADAVGFAVLMLIDIPAIKNLALMASIGVAILICTNLILLPILLSYVGVSARAAARSLREELKDLADVAHEKHPLWQFLDVFTHRRHAVKALVVAAALGAGGLVVAHHLKVGDLDPGAPELRPESRYNRDNAFVTSHYATSSDILVIMAKTRQYGCVHYGNLALTDALEWELQQLAGVESTSSFVGLVKKSAVGLNEGSLSWYELPRTQDVLNAIAVRAPRELFNQECDLLLIYVYLKDHKADTLSAVTQKVEDFAAANDSPEIEFQLAAGNAGIEAATNMVVGEANAHMLLMVYAAVSLLCFITFRSWRAVLCAILPLALTSVLCEALMVKLGIGVKVATLPVIALGVGIGVDYALYVISVTLTHLRDGKSLSEAYYRALLFTGKIVVLTGVTLGLGVATWAFSPIKFQADMGILLAFMFIWNMLGALILLPALAALLLSPREGAPQPNPTAGVEVTQ
ncbi:MAG: MMPL family transporter [Rhodocyclales bacterium]|nr:MMPL family transporter [Rhodocyclales bacterium]